jgi:hypothetical protein
VCATRQAFKFSVPPLRGDEQAQTLTLYSEQAFYYSFFLRAVTAPSAWDAVASLVHDATAEYPSVVVPLQR